MKNRFTGIVEKPYDQKRERKSKPIIIIIANYKNPNPKKENPASNNVYRKLKTDMNSGDKMDMKYGWTLKKKSNLCCPNYIQVD